MDRPLKACPLRFFQAQHPPLAGVDMASLLSIHLSIPLGFWGALLLKQGTLAIFSRWVQQGMCSTCFCFFLGFPPPPPPLFSGREGGSVGLVLVSLSTPAKEGYSQETGTRPIAGSLRFPFEPVQVSPCVHQF